MLSRFQNVFCESYPGYKNYFIIYLFINAFLQEGIDLDIIWRSYEYDIMSWHLIAYGSLHIWSSKKVWFILSSQAQLYWCFCSFRRCCILLGGVSGTSRILDSLVCSGSARVLVAGFDFNLAFTELKIVSSGTSSYQSNEALKDGLPTLKLSPYKLGPRTTWRQEVLEHNKQLPSRPESR